MEKEKGLALTTYKNYYKEALYFFNKSK